MYVKCALFALGMLIVGASVFKKNTGSFCPVSVRGSKNESTNYSNTGCYHAVSHVK